MLRAADGDTPSLPQMRLMFVAYLNCSIYRAFARG